MTEQFEFLSAQWFVALEAHLEALAPVAQREIGDRAFTFQETFVGALPSGEDVTWHCTFEGGAVTSFGRCAVDDADIVVRVPGDVGRQLVSTRRPTTLSDESSYAELVGRVEREIRCEPAVAARLATVMAGLHDMVAEMTAPPAEHS